MDIKPEQYGDEELLKSVQKALNEWKLAEYNYSNMDLYNEHTVEILKKNYLALLTEVRKRNLSLTPKQLLKVIIFPYPFNKN